MATNVPQRELRNNTAALLRRVEAGERIHITVHGHPVAELAPIGKGQRFLPLEEICNGLRGLLGPDDNLYEELKAMDDYARDPFE